MRRGNGRFVSKAYDIRTHETFCKNFSVSFFDVKKSRELPINLYWHMENQKGKSERAIC
jgi:hypothetical protein